MARDMGMMSKTCNCQHHKWFGWVVLVAGVLYLLSDLNWIGWWSVNWWTVAFVLIGLGAMCKCCSTGKCF